MNFESKAFGEDLHDSIEKVRNEVEQKYHSIKQKFIKDYENQLRALIDPQLNEIEGKIKTNQYSSPADLISDIKNLKNSYFEETKAISYNLKKLMLIEKTEEVMMKGMEALYRNLKDSTSIESR